MPSYNSVTIIGHLGHDPELRAVNDTEVAGFSLAVNNPYKRDDPPAWFRISAWGKLAETCERYLRKGDPVLVTGEIWPREYEDRDGNTRTSLDVRASKVAFLGKGGEDSSSTRDSRPPRDREPGEDDEEKLPF